MLQWNELRRALKRANKNIWNLVKLEGKKDSERLQVTIMSDTWEIGLYDLYCKLETDVDVCIDAVELDKLLGYIKDIPTISAKTESEVKEEYVGTKVSGESTTKNVKHYTDTITLSGGGRNIETKSYHEGWDYSTECFTEKVKDSAKITEEDWDIILKAKGYAYEDESRKILNGVCLHPKYIAGTDGRRLYVHKNNIQLSDEEAPVIDVPRLFFNKKKLQRIEITEKYFRLIGDGFVIAKRKSEGTFPNFFSVMPDNEIYTEKFDITKEVYDLCQLVIKLDGPQLNFKTQEHLLADVKATSETKEYRTIIASNKHKDNQAGIELTYNAQFISQAYKDGFRVINYAIDKEKNKAAIRPAKLTSNIQGEYMYLMPMSE